MNEVNEFSYLMKLNIIQGYLKVPKSKVNEYSPSKFHYRTCDDIMEALKPFLIEQKVIILMHDEIVKIENRFYVKSTAKFICCETGKSIESYAYAREEESKKGMDSCQVTGTASSYARKYALNALLGPRSVAWKPAPAWAQA